MEDGDGGETKTPDAKTSGVLEDANGGEKRF